MELHVGTGDIALNRVDLDTKFHFRRRFDELLMFSLRIRVCMIVGLGAQERRTERDNGDASLTG